MKRFVGLSVLAVLLSVLVSGCVGTPGDYHAALTVNSFAAMGTYDGQAPTNDYWLVLDATVTNNGNASLPIAASNWELLDDTFGLPLATASSKSCVQATIGPGQTRNATLVFDVSQFGDPAKLSLNYPGGESVAAFLRPGNGTTGAGCLPQEQVPASSRGTDPAAIVVGGIIFLLLFIVLPIFLFMTWRKKKRAKAQAAIQQVAQPPIAMGGPQQMQPVPPTSRPVAASSPPPAQPTGQLACPRCGAGNIMGATFCNACGNRLR